MNCKNVNVSEFICECVGADTRACLVHLDLSGTLKPHVPPSPSVESVAAALEDKVEEGDILLGTRSLAVFANLRSLNLAGTALHNEALSCLTSQCVSLQHLNIASTLVSDLSPLICLTYCDGLRNLVLHGLQLADPDDALTVLSQLRALEVLDISGFPTPERETSFGAHFIKKLPSNCLVNLRVLDVSGTQANFCVNEFKWVLLFMFSVDQFHENYVFCGFFYSVFLSR